MSEHRTRHPSRHPTAGPWVLDTRELGRRPGTSRDYELTVPSSAELGVPDVVTVAAGTPIHADLLAEAVVEGVLITGTVRTEYTGVCSRCLDPVRAEVSADVLELFAYPDSTTEETTDADEVFRLVDDRIDLEPIVRDAIVLALPQAPLCSDDCAGLCDECGRKWADLEPGHVHEKIDPRWAALRERFGDPGADQT